MSITWLKLHHEIIHDIKLRKFSAQEKWALVVLLVLASESDPRGVITADDEDIADMCEFNSKQDWLYFRDKLIAKGILEHAEGGLKILNWEKRQHIKPSDRPEATKERKRKQRNKQKQFEEEMSRDVTPLSRDVTPLSRDVTPLSRDVTHKSRMSHATDTDTDQDPDPDPKKVSLSPKGSLSHEQPTAERETSANAPLTAKQPAADIDPALVYGKTKSNPGRSQFSHGQTQSSAPPPPDIFQLKCWAQFKAPGKHPAFWLDIVEQTRRFREPPANPEAAAEGWIQKQGHLLWDVFVKKQNRKLEQPLNLSDAIAAIETSLNRLGWTKTQAIAHMIEHHGWARMMLSHHSAQNLSLLNDQELLELQNVVGHLTHSPSRRNSHAL
jgi:hypothetical protein